ncbi:MAG: radical SAM protein [Candidatus Omnitrophota bacterium]
MNFIDQLSYASRIFKKSGPLIQLTFFITSRCNLRCPHCFYWKELDSDHSRELTIDEITRIADLLPRLLLLSITGGEPFVRNDVDKIYGIFSEKTRTPIITISSNGFFVGRMSELVPRMLERHPKTKLLLYLSLDGPEEIHDKIRGEHSYQHVMTCLDMLQMLRKRFNNLGVSLAMTCNKLNEDYLEETFNEFKNSGKVDNISLAFVRGNPQDPQAKENVSIEKYRRLTALKMDAIDNRQLPYFDLFLKNLISGKDYYTYQIVEEVLRHNRCVISCQAGSLFGVLYDNGDVYPCEILNAPVGNIRDFDYNLPELWAAEAAQKARETIRQGCRCTFECAMSSSILFNLLYLAKIGLRALPKMARRRPSIL